MSKRGDSTNLLNQEDFDAEHGYVLQPLSFKRNIVSKVRRTCACTKNSCWLSLVRLFPIIHWLPRYNWKENAFADFIAGCTVGIMHIPQGMAYGNLAGIDAVHGLYTSFFPSLFYLFMGTSRHISLGTFAVICLMVASVRYRLIPSTDFNVTSTWGAPINDEHIAGFSGQPITPVDVASSLCLLVGFLQLLMGLLRLGFLSSYLSDQVVSGYTTGAAVYVLVAQFDKVLGIGKVGQFDGPFKLFYILRSIAYRLPYINVTTVIISIVSISILFLTKEFLSPIVKRYCKLPIPIELIVVISGTLASKYGHFEEKYNVTIVDVMPTGLPKPSIPRFDIMPMLLGDAFSISIVIFSVSVSMGKIFAKRHNYKIDANQEFNALGVMECATSFFQCFPSSGSLGRSVVFEGAGAKSQLAGLVSCSIILIVLLWLGPFFQDLPNCVLSSIIIVALKGLFVHFKELPKLWKTSKIDFAIWLVSFGAVVLLDVTWGLAVAVGFALLSLILRSQWPSTRVLGRVSGTDVYADLRHYSTMEDVPGVRIFRFNSALHFANAELFRESLLKKCLIDIDEAKRLLASGSQLPYTTVQFRPSSSRSTPDENGNSTSASSSYAPICEDSSNEQNYFSGYPHHVIIDCSGINYADTMGVNVLKQVYQELEEIGICVFIVSCNATLSEVFCRTELHKIVPKKQFYFNISDAVRAAAAAYNE